MPLVRIGKKKVLNFIIVIIIIFFCLFLLFFGVVLYCVLIKRGGVPTGYQECRDTFCTSFRNTADEEPGSAEDSQEAPASRAPLLPAAPLSPALEPYFGSERF